MSLNRLGLCALAKNINGYNGFTATYDNLAGHNVTISRRYTSHDSDICRKKDSTNIKFIVYHSGKVTQSGPNEELNEKAYNKFMETLEDIRTDVIKVKSRYIYI